VTDIRQMSELHKECTVSARNFVNDRQGYRTVKRTQPLVVLIRILDSRDPNPRE
jgi:hypothetical protein